MKTRKIGEIFELEQDIYLKVVEQNICEGCFFNDDDEGCTAELCYSERLYLGHCSESYRADHKPIIFKQVHKIKTQFKK